MFIVFREFTQIIASDGLDSVIIGCQAISYNDIYQMEVLLPIELVCVVLPELFCVAWSPSKLLSLNLVFELLNGTVNLLILIKVFVQFLQHCVNVFVNPMSILQFYYQVKSIDIR